MTKNKILFAAAECAPFVKVGGLADVAGSLPKALKKLGVDVSVIIPFYESISIDEKDLDIIKKDVEISFAGKIEKVDLYKTILPNSDVQLILVSNKRYFSGDPYSGDKTRFIFFSKSIVETAGLMNFKTIHCHDWHTAIVPYLAKNTKTIFTIHNIAYQGVFDSETINLLIESNFSDEINCMELGIENSDIVTTVSPNYAKEILTPEFGFGLEKTLNKRKDSLFGIINGIDPDQFNPEKDKAIVQNYSFEKIDKRIINKENLQRECFDSVDLEIPLIGMVTRIADQKGFNLIEEALPELMRLKLQLVILGTGTEYYEKILTNTSNKYSDKMFVKTSFDDLLARKIYAGSDLFLMPSHFEPCGLGQMIAMSYGSLPIVREVGGLKDTVIPYGQEGATGFAFNEASSQALLKAVNTALNLFKEKSAWRKLQRDAMSRDFSWENSAKEYLNLYR
jgi:starch synthase